MTLRSSKDVLKSFPKTRPQLNPGILQIYEDEYQKNRDGSTLASFLSQFIEGWMHRCVARSNRALDQEATATLEIGAGTLNQLPYENKIHNYDVVEPMIYLYDDNPNKLLVRKFFKDISEIPINQRYDRIISVAVLEHLDNLPNVIECSINHLNPGGVFACGIPSEGGFLWGLAWRLTTGLEFRIRTGQDYGNIMKHEHINEASEIETLLKHYFYSVKIKTFGLGRHFSLYRYIECRDPIILSK